MKWFRAESAGGGGVSEGGGGEVRSRWSRSMGWVGKEGIESRKLIFKDLKSLDLLKSWLR